MESGPADAVVAAKLDRVARSVVDFAGLLKRAEAGGWRVVVLDLNLDLGTPQGNFVAHILAAVAELERDLIRERTRAALAVARANGVRLGRPPVERPVVLARVVTERSAGRTLRQITGLNEDDVSTTRGAARGPPGTVHALLQRHRRQQDFQGPQDGPGAGEEVRTGTEGQAI